MLLQSLVALMSTPHAKHTDPALLLEYLLLVKNWLLEPQGGGESTVFSRHVDMLNCGGRQLEGLKWHMKSLTLATPCSCPINLGAGGWSLPGSPAGAI